MYDENTLKIMRHVLGKCLNCRLTGGMLVISMVPLSNSPDFVIHPGRYQDVNGGYWKERGTFLEFFVVFRI